MGQQVLLCFIIVLFFYSFAIRLIFNDFLYLHVMHIKSPRSQGVYETSTLHNIFSSVQSYRFSLQLSLQIFRLLFQARQRETCYIKDSPPEAVFITSQPKEIRKNERMFEC